MNSYVRLGIFVYLTCCVFKSEAFDPSLKVKYQLLYSFNAPAFQLQETGLEQAMSLNLGFTEQVQDWKIDTELLMHIDFYNNELSHVDIKQLIASYSISNLTFKVGVDEINWSITETRSLTNIVNQVNSINSIYDDEYLGQPLVGLQILEDDFAFNIYLMPYFRERFFPPMKSRRRLALPVADKSIYESKKRRHHLDLAARYLHYLGDFEVALSYFRGTNRRPIMMIYHNNNEPKIQAYYPQSEQLGLTMLLSTDNTIFKSEIVTLRSQDSNYLSGDIAIEHSISFVDWGPDIDLFIEYLWDERKNNADTPYQNDIATTVKLNFNDLESTALRLSWIRDLSNKGNLIRLFFNRRINDSIKLNVDITLIAGTRSYDPLFFIADDDFIKISLSYSF